MRSREEVMALDEDPLLKTDVANPSPLARDGRDGPADERVAPLAAEVEMRAMVELGKRRASLRHKAFVIGWPVCTAVLMFLGFGIIPAAVIGSAAAGAFTKVYVVRRNRSLVEEVCRDLGINPLAFWPERYLID
jgi:anti-sigma factor RsiW